MGLTEMKIKDDFILSKLGKQYVVVAVGEASKTFNALIRLNETGAFLWEILKSGSDRQSLAKALVDEYAVSSETAVKDSDAFVEKLRLAGVLDE